MGESDYQVQEPNLGVVENGTLVEEANDRVGRAQKKEVGEDTEDEAVHQIENPDFPGDNDTAQGEDFEEAPLNEEIEGGHAENNIKNNPTKDNNNSFDENEFDQLEDEENNQGERNP